MLECSLVCNKRQQAGTRSNELHVRISSASGKLCYGDVIQRLLQYRNFVFCINGELSTTEYHHLPLLFSLLPNEGCFLCRAPILHLESTGKTKLYTRTGRCENNTERRLQHTSLSLADDKQKVFLSLSSIVLG